MTNAPVPTASTGKYRDAPNRFVTVGGIRSLGLNPILRFVVRMLSRGIVRKAKRRGVDYAFLFMRADGQQLAEIARLIDAGVIRAVVDQVFPFAQTADALAYVETGRAKGKVVVKVS